MAAYYALDVTDIAKRRKRDDKQPFPHQKEAFTELSKTLTLPINGYKGTLLVLPTGGGKTFTAVEWVCRNILANGIKVLWLAQSSYLIDQAAETFLNEIHKAAGRDRINLRIVSSSTKHSNAGSIDLTDDVLICTTQTAISAYSAEAMDGRGNPVKSNFRKFIDSQKDKEFFVVIDEAHHTPAYGCRTLLLSLRQEIENLYILGLTATPMHMDKRISGWLKKIYDRWICYEADKSKLQAMKILSIEKYLEKDTHIEYNVDDALYDRLVNKHKDLPEAIIERLASDSGRNNFIVSDYINNKDDYGKTLIFADRWFQCEYIAEKINEQGARAAAVYSAVTGQDEIYRGGSGRRNDEENRQIMRDFRKGKYDVIVNVKMLTEGVDVPDVKTVMITRQTTSNILMTQMIGRALRGEKAGGGADKHSANIVFFCDNWKRALPWAEAEGGLGEGRITQHRNYMELVSIQLVRLATQDIEYKGFENAPFLTFIPVGFFGCEYTAALEDASMEELISTEDFIIAYEFNKFKYDRLLDFILTLDLTPYAAENLNDDELAEKARGLARNFFDVEIDGFNGELIDNIKKLIRHVAQNETKPVFIDFNERDVYDMDRLADELIRTPPEDADIILTNKFNDDGLHWKFFYKCFDNFFDAYQKAQKRILAKRRGEYERVEIKPNEPVDELTYEIKQQVFTRDKYRCLCCDKPQGKGRPLNVDHIRPVSMGGGNSLSNLQTLCKQCNALKGINEVDYRANVTPLRRPKKLLQEFEYVYSDDVNNIIARVVNEFYHCKAMRKLNYHQRRNGQYYFSWEIELFSGNNPKWLAAHEDELLEYVHKALGWEHVEKIVVKSV
jgi:superfamily II DNA or RNA helicase